MAICMTIDIAAYVVLRSSIACWSEVMVLAFVLILCLRLRLVLLLLLIPRRLPGSAKASARGTNH